jgi:phage N-6-adenine-methyltransferase
VTAVVEVHPAAALFPMISDADLDQMAADIRDRGLVHPLVRDQTGRLLDGRNRLEACRRAGVTPRWTAYEGTDPVRFVMSVNLERRHLSEDERAFLALELLPIIEAEALPRMLAGVADPPLILGEGSGQRHERESTARAATAVKVKRERVRKAKAVASHPDLVEKVKGGKVSMSKAETIAKQRAAGLADADGDAWYTPPWLFDQIGLRFDIDVCAPADLAQRTCPAGNYYTEADDGLAQPWHGLVWCNPPYSTPETWADRMADHGNGILLTHMPNNAAWMVRAQWAASSVRLIQSMHFVRPNGAVQRPGYSLMLATFGAHLADALADITESKVGPLWRR